MSKLLYLRKLSKILVYSNSQQQIEIISTESLPAGTQIRVFNAAGQTIAQMQAAGNRISIPASISKGVYFCHIENTNQNLQYKVIVR
ncbi:MAG: T9SS type A sorting domain-containing protein [Bacteroidia bacterium]|nr:T9SS type A sorting domain-containing protein [Bacteroidia bacterium]